MAELIINSELKAGDTIKVDYDKETDKVLTSVEKPAPAATPDESQAEGNPVEE